MSENPNVGKVFNLTGGGSNGSLKLESLDVTKPPIKTTYKSGESFDPTGMVVEASYGFGLTSGSDRIYRDPLGLDRRASPRSPSPIRRAGPPRRPALL